MAQLEGGGLEEQLVVFIHSSGYYFADGVYFYVIVNVREQSVEGIFGDSFVFGLDLMETVDAFADQLTILLALEVDVELVVIGEYKSFELIEDGRWSKGGAGYSLEMKFVGLSLSYCLYVYVELGIIFHKSFYIF